MNTDIRLSCGFWSHPKTKRLVKRLGLEGVRSLQVLWLWAAQERPSGCLSGMDAEDIELAADWNGEDGKFFAECLGRWIDEAEDGFCLHDWEDHNAWASEAEFRGDSARLSRLARVNKEAAAGLKADGRTGITKDEYRKYAEGTPYERRTTVPSTPAPTPTLRKEESTTPLPPVHPAPPGLEPYSLEFLEFWDAYPNKEAQDDAWIAWLELKKARKHPGLSVLQDAICVQEQGERWQDPKFIPSPGAWLRKGRWKDKPPEPRAAPRASPPRGNLTPRQQQTEMFKGMAQAIKRAEGAGNGENHGGRCVEGALPTGTALPRP